MDRSRRQGFGMTLLALVVGLGQLPSLVTIATNPTVSVVDRPYAPMMIVAAAALLSLGILRLRNPALFENQHKGYEPRPLPLFIIAGGLVGIGAMLFVIVS